MGYSRGEVARYLGVTGFCVTRIVAERELAEEVSLRYQDGYTRSARTSPILVSPESVQ